MVLFFLIRNPGIATRSKDATSRKPLVAKGIATCLTLRWKLFYMALIWQCGSRQNSTILTWSFTHSASAGAEPFALLFLGVLADLLDSKPL